MKLPAPHRRQSSAESRRGIALVLSLMLVMVVAILGAAFTQLSSRAASEQSHAVKQLQSFYLAEAGLAEAFLSVRMGRNGSIGTADSPASFGPGRIWVESVHTPDRRVYLRSTALLDRTRVRLGLVVRPEDPPLGFFASEDVVVESVLLVDGFDSTERSYAEEVAFISDGLSSEPLGPESGGGTPRPLDPALAAGQEAVQLYLGTAEQSVIEALLAHQVTSNGKGSFTLVHSPIDPFDFWSMQELSAFMGDLNVIYPAFEADQLFAGQGDWVSLLDGSFASLLMSGWFSVEPESELRLEHHTMKGGLLGAGGDVRFEGGVDHSVEVHGSVVPGVNGSVVGAAPGSVSGSLDPRVMPVELEPVQVPTFASEGPFIVDSAFPTVISGGQMAYDSLTIADSRDLVLRGPMTLVVDEMILGPGARLTLDTADGDVEIFIRGELSMDPTSYLETTQQTSKEVKIKAGGDEAVTSTIDLAGMAQFHGTIYAPETNVKIGSNFEIFGGAIAKRLEIAAGARLHFDSEAYDSDLPVPDQESWRILELPLTPKIIPTPAAAGTLVALHQAHDLAAVDIIVDYVDASGVSRRFSGPESSFDWSQAVSADVQQRTLRPNAASMAAEAAPPFESAADPMGASELVAAATATAGASDELGSPAGIGGFEEAADADDGNWWDSWGKGALMKLVENIVQGVSEWKGGE